MQTATLILRALNTSSSTFAILVLGLDTRFRDVKTGRNICTPALGLSQMVGACTTRIARTLAKSISDAPILCARMGDVGRNWKKRMLQKVHRLSRKLCLVCGFREREGTLLCRPCGISYDREIFKDNTAANVIRWTARRVRLSDRVWTCHHCGTVIKNKEDAWSRKGRHWCSRMCMEQSQPGTDQEPLKPIMRKNV
jgi:hypothetical protein